MGRRSRVVSIAKTKGEVISRQKFGPRHRSRRRLLPRRKVRKHIRLGGDQRAGTGGNPPVAGGAYPFIFLIYSRKPRIVETGQNPGRIVSGPIVHDDEFKMRPSLGQHGMNGPAQNLAPVVGGKNHGSTNHAQHPGC